MKHYLFGSFFLKFFKEIFFREQSSAINKKPNMILSKKEWVCQYDIGYIFQKMGK